ncbi:MAG: acetylglutamate kinase [Candidatus Nitrosocaldaceae archaeon]|nr:MAG: acetylglutamate kinase [Candidatus Nitrosocaldaceae archaeon]
MVSILKLGGSVITYKDKPLAFNANIIEEISKNLKQINKPLIIVHGGGSFGHYYSVKYDMHSKPDRYDIHGVSVVRTSMVELNNYIVNIMVRYGLNPYTIPPISFMNGKDVIKNKVIEIARLAEEGLLPITHGDVMPIDDKMYYILSGDEIMSILASILKPDKIIFAINVDGIYNNMEERRLIRELSANDVLQLEDVKADVTGGMKRKLREAFKIASNGLPVMLVNGLKPERIVKALNDEPVICTMVKS